MISQQETSWTKAEKILLALVGLLLAFACFMQYYAPAGGDQAWQLLAVHMWLGGGKLFVDIFEVNPPLILWLYALPVLLAQHLRFISEGHVLVLLAFGVIACSITLSDALVALHPRATKRRRVMFALLLGALFVLFINPLHFADREHLFVVLVFPYLLRFAPFCARLTLPRRLSCCIGLLAGVGFCMKPHCAILFAGVQLLFLLRERSAFILWSVENLLIYILSLSYLLAIGYFTPEYYTVVLPMALATYGGFNNRNDWIFYAALALLIFAVTFIDFRLRYRTPYRRDIYYFLGLLPFLCAYALVNNGWAYTYVPLNFMLVLLSGLVLLDQWTLYREQGIRRGLQGMRACMLVIATKALITLAIYLIALHAAFDDKDYQTKRDAELESLVRDNHAHTFGVLSANFGMWPPLVAATGAKLVTRFNYLWMFPRIIAGDEAFTQSHAWVVAYVAHGFADDLRHHRPDIVFVDRSPYYFQIKRRADVPALLSEYADFREEWAHYRLDGGVNTCRPPLKKYIPNFCHFDLYRRMP